MSNLNYQSNIDIKDLCIPIADCESVTIGKISKEKVNLLEDSNFDYAPVINESGEHVYGLVETKYLKKLLENKKFLYSDDPILSEPNSFIEFGDSVQLEELLNIFLNKKAVIIVSEINGGNYGPVQSIKGLLTVSDLNRYPVRHALYGILFILESGLAKLIQKSFDDPWDWISKLGDMQKVRIFGYWELSRRKDLDIGPLAATMLSELITIIGKTQGLLGILGYNSKKEFSKDAEKINKLRNSVMHPVKPIFLKHGDVTQIHKNVIFMEDLLKKLVKLS